MTLYLAPNSLSPLQMMSSLLMSSPSPTPIDPRDQRAIVAVRLTKKGLSVCGMDESGQRNSCVGVEEFDANGTGGRTRRRILSPFSSTSSVSSITERLHDVIAYVKSVSFSIEQNCLRPGDMWKWYGRASSHSLDGKQNPLIAVPLLRLEMGSLLNDVINPISFSFPTDLFSACSYASLPYIHVIRTVTLRQLNRILKKETLCDWLYPKGSPQCYNVLSIDCDIETKHWKEKFRRNLDEVEVLKKLIMRIRELSVQVSHFWLRLIGVSGRDVVKEALRRAGRDNARVENEDPCPIHNTSCPSYLLRSADLVYKLVEHIDKQGAVVGISIDTLLPDHAVVTRLEGLNQLTEGAVMVSLEDVAPYFGFNKPPLDSLLNRKRLTQYHRPWNISLRKQVSNAPTLIQRLANETAANKTLRSYPSPISPIEHYASFPQRSFANNRILVAPPSSTAASPTSMVVQVSSGPPSTTASPSSLKEEAIKSSGRYMTSSKKTATPFDRLMPTPYGNMSSYEIQKSPAAELLQEHTRSLKKERAKERQTSTAQPKQTLKEALVNDYFAIKRSTEVLCSTTRRVQSAGYLKMMEKEFEKKEVARNAEKTSANSSVINIASSQCQKDSQRQNVNEHRQSSFDSDSTIEAGDIEEEKDSLGYLVPSKQRHQLKEWDYSSGLPTLKQLIERYGSIDEPVRRILPSINLVSSSIDQEYKEENRKEKRDKPNDEVDEDVEDEEEDEEEQEMEREHPLRGKQNARLGWKHAHNQRWNGLYDKVRLSDRRVLAWRMGNDSSKNPGDILVDEDGRSHLERHILRSRPMLRSLSDDRELAGGPQTEFVFTQMDVMLCAVRRMTIYQFCLPHLSLHRLLVASKEGKRVEPPTELLQLEFGDVKDKSDDVSVYQAFPPNICLFYRYASVLFKRVFTIKRLSLFLSAHSDTPTSFANYLFISGQHRSFSYLSIEAHNTKYKASSSPPKRIRWNSSAKHAVTAISILLKKLPFLHSNISFMLIELDGLTNPQILSEVLKTMGEVEKKNVQMVAEGVPFTRFSSGRASTRPVHIRPSPSEPAHRPAPSSPVVVTSFMYQCDDARYRIRLTEWNEKFGYKVTVRLEKEDFRLLQYIRTNQTASPPSVRIKF